MSQGLYARDFIDAWEKVIGLLQPADYFNDQLAFGAFTRAPSPLERVLLEVRRNSSFEGGASAVAGRALKQKLSSSRMGQLVQNYNSGRDTGLDAGGAISSHFDEIKEYVGDGKSDSPLRQFVAAVKAAGESIYSARSAVASGTATDELQSRMATAVTSVKLAGGSAPPQLQKFVKDAAGTGTRAQVTTVTGAVATSWNDASGACKEVADQRYPFFGASPQDAQMLDMLRVFGGGGTLNRYVEQHLKPLIDTSGPMWRWREDNVITAGFSPRLAGRIRKGRADSGPADDRACREGERPAVRQRYGRGRDLFRQQHATVRQGHAGTARPVMVAARESGSIRSDVPGDPGAASASAGRACGDGGTGRLDSRGEPGGARSGCSFAPAASASAGRASARRARGHSSG